MKLRDAPRPRIATFTLFLTLSAGLTAFVGCDDSAANRETVESVAPSTSAEESVADSSLLGSIRSTADNAFAALSRADGKTATRSRSTSRIGPQPWPSDLPTAWPRLERAQVLADTRRNGDRLLLVDLPGGPDRAAGEFEGALRDQGYRVDPLTTRSGRALHAESDDHEAVLTFYPREKVTRLEILFPAKRTS